MNDVLVKKSAISTDKLEIMLEFVLDKYPSAKNNFSKLSEVIVKEFKINCTPAIVENYYAKIAAIEDFELESRGIEYGYRM